MRWPGITRRASVAAFTTTWDGPVQYWTRFAHTGDPNGPGLPAWPRFDGNTVQSLKPGAVGPINADEQHHCGFWL